MEKEIEELQVFLENIDTNLHDMDYYAKELYKLHLQGEIDLLTELNKIAEDRDFNGTAYFNMIYIKIELLQEKLKLI